MRNRLGPMRPKVDENAVGRHSRQSSASLAGVPRAGHNLSNVGALKNAVHRAALGEVTTVAVNRNRVSHPTADSDMCRWPVYLLVTHMFFTHRSLPVSLSVRARRSSTPV
ncbi:hypothetical protein BDW22DRAFT_1352134 [Trametopsis cervina]|nr:hypothetical protein BDW22DRAFT_1352134 [Trametopsis cervina]